MVELYTDQETYGIMGKEPALIISNHRSDIDWLVGWVLAQRVGCLGNTIALAKKSLSYLPLKRVLLWLRHYPLNATQIKEYALKPSSNQAKHKHIITVLSITLLTPVTGSQTLLLKV
ncbi:hypothetical protein MTR67_049135 [Solanum verrucosum]|uniref:Phospholipid/glycerol acyltransferase domain-containing protein n=1 Tax=Solanum verrucosum TaxID=315347 RepID=A0AAF0UZP4_SOLVR|nr:hypothetical protein MTR67_049135 [Solanum verrucosum]